MLTSASSSSPASLNGKPTDTEMDESIREGETAWLQKNADLPMDAGSCSFWCAVAIGGLVQGQPREKASVSKQKYMRRNVASGVYCPTVRRVGWTLLPLTCFPYGILGLLDWFQVQGYAMKAKSALESCADEAAPTELARYADIFPPRLF